MRTRTVDDHLNIVEHMIQTYSQLLNLLVYQLVKLHRHPLIANATHVSKFPFPDRYRERVRPVLYGPEAVP